MSLEDRLLDVGWRTRAAASAPGTLSPEKKLKAIEAAEDEQRITDLLAVGPVGHRAIASS